VRYLTFARKWESAWNEVEGKTLWLSLQRSILLLRLSEFRR
jgi:hypothetical protein